MNQPQPNNPLHGVTLQSILEYLVAEYGWDRLGERIPIRCFNEQPSIKSSLKFLRKTEWARTKVEILYLNSIDYDQRKSPGDVGVRDDSPEEPGERDLHNREARPGSVWDRARRK